MKKSIPYLAGFLKNIYLPDGAGWSEPFPTVTFLNLKFKCLYFSLFFSEFPTAFQCTRKTVRNYGYFYKGIVILIDWYFVERLGWIIKPKLA